MTSIGRRHGVRRRLGHRILGFADCRVDSLWRQQNVAKHDEYEQREYRGLNRPGFKQEEEESNLGTPLAISPVAKTT